MSLRYFLSTFVLLASLNAFAFPIAPPSLLRPPLPPAGPAGQYDFEGIIALSGCSGSLVQFEGQPDTDQAYVMTNGHCHEGGFIPPNQYIYARSSSRRFTLLKPDGSDAGRIRANQTVYATMSKTDLALYRVNETYAEIRQHFQIRPLTLQSTHPIAGTPIDIISGYWRRGYSCDIDGFVFRLLEGGWENNDSIRFTRECNTVGGTSGSPILARGTRIAIGVNNTGNQSGGRCTENNPCEVDANGNVTYSRGLNYGQQTYWLYSCLNERFEIDLQKSGCELSH